MRVSTACTSCRTRRKKCIVIPGSCRCVLCESQNIICSKTKSIEASIHRLVKHESQPTVTHSGKGTSLWAKSLCIELVELYFRYIHDQFHSLFHKTSFLNDLEHGQAPMVLVYGMMALSARFSENPVFDGTQRTKRGEVYAKEANALLDLRHVSLSTVQACVLLGATSISDGEAMAETIFYSAACRIANCLDLPNTKSSCPVTREVCLRVYWTLCMIDIWSSDGMNLPRQMSRKHDVQLPMDEEAFHRLVPGARNALVPTGVTDNEGSLLAQMIKLNTILLEVNDYIKDLTTASLPLLSEERVSSLSLKLDSWLQSLPQVLCDTPENMHHFASRGLGRFFVAIYLGYYHFGQLLFYQYLDEQQRGGLYYSIAAEVIESGVMRCKDFAMSLSNIIDRAAKMPGCDVRYNMVGHITVVASSVMIHTLLYQTDETEIADAKSQLERNFNTMVELRKYWPALEFCFSRLKTFHELCMKSMDTSYRMDRWMLRFLTEFARPIAADEREDGENSDLDFNTWLAETIGA